MPASTESIAKSLRKLLDVPREELTTKIVGTMLEIVIEGPTIPEDFDENTIAGIADVDFKTVEQDYDEDIDVLVITIYDYLSVDSADEAEVEDDD
jgi:hypothetical protein